MHEVVKGESVSQWASTPSGALGTASGEAVAYYGSEFWRRENLKFSAPWYRLQKCAGIVNGVVRGRSCTLLDVGCGPAALRRLVPENVEYYGIDIAIQDPSPNLREADILGTPIRFGDRRFDVVIASGVFEYFGEFQSEKLREISEVIKQGGTFIVSYTNFSHRAPQVYERVNNVQSIAKFRQSLDEWFQVDHMFPASHNWKHSQPSRRIVRYTNMHFSMNVPWISPVLAVEYFFICSPRPEGTSRVR